MKKSILALLILLVVLIVTCVYQKTYTLYSTSPKELTLIERASTEKSAVKTVAVEKIPSTIPVVSVPTPIKPVKVKPLLETKPTVAHTPVSETEDTVKKEAKEKAAPSAKNKVPKAVTAEKIQPVIKNTEKKALVLPKESSVPTVVTAKKPSTESTSKPQAATHNAADKEIVDYIMWALKNRELALKNRDEVEARIHELITKALNDRKVVLDERSKNEVVLEKQQTELIDARDADYESVINPKTTTQGEK